MKEYIEREALIELIEENSETKFDWSECVDIDILRPAIRDIPAADVAPVVHAEWKQGGGIHYCSNCGEGALYRYIGSYSPDVYQELTEYCPHCGAKMNGGNK